MITHPEAGLPTLFQMSLMTHKRLVLKDLKTLYNRGKADRGDTPSRSSAGRKGNKELCHEDASSNESVFGNKPRCVMVISLERDTVSTETGGS